MHPNQVTVLLNEVQRGVEGSASKLLEAVYEELRVMAAAKMRSERSDHTLQPTALVNEAYLRLAGNLARLEDRGHFFGAAAKAMERVLVDHARAKSAQKRGGDAARLTFVDVGLEIDDAGLDVLGVHEALEELGRADEELAALCRYRYFVGMSLEQIAEINGQSLSTVKRQWTYAKAWLTERVERKGRSDDR